MMETQEVPQEAPQEAPQKKDFISKIIQNQKGSPLYKEAATILEVIHESLQTNLKVTPDMPEYPTALFGSVLKNLQISTNKDNYDHISAHFLLFQYAVQRVNPQVRQRHSELIEKCVKDVLGNVSKNKIEQKYILGIYSSLLQVKSPAEWKKESTMEMFDYILDALDSEKMAIRKKASKCLSSLAEHGLFTVPKMDFRLQQHFIEIIKSSHLNPRRAVFALYFLNHALKFFPVRAASEISFNLVNALKSEDINAELATHIYSTLESLLAAKPLSSELVEGFLQDLLGHPPIFVEESNINYAYVQCLSQAILHLNTVDSKTAKNYISSCISACNEYLISSNQKLAAVTCKTIELIITHTVNKSLWGYSAPNEESLESFLGIDTLVIDNNENEGPTTFQKVVLSLKYLLSPQFDYVQKYVSSIYCTFYEQLDHTCPEAAHELIVAWINARGEKQPNIWQPVVGKFMQKINLEFLLKAFPLRIVEADITSPNYENESNSWLLPVLRKYLRIDSIKLFLDYFLPIIAILDDYVYSKKAEEYTEVEKTYELIYIQIWEIFPRFCKFTKENVSFIEQIFEITTKVITSRQNVRKFVCQGLEILTSYFLKLPKYTNPQMIKAQEILVASSNKLMPKLCAMFMKEASGYKNIIKLIRTLANLCSKDFLETVFLRHIKKLIQEKSEKKPHTITHLKECDILIAMARSMDLATHYDICKQFIIAFLDDKSTFQKRAFKVLQVLAVKVHSSFLSELIELLEDEKLLQTPNKLGKLTCTLAILEKLEYSTEKMEEVVQIIQKLLPEILLALKETNRKTRAVAISTLKFLTKKFQEFEAGPLFASLVTAGLAAKTSLMKSTAILGMAQVIKEGFDETFVWETTSIVLLMIKEKNREIFKAVLQFLKAYVKITPKPELQKNLQNILVPLFEWDPDARDQSRLTLRHIVEKLVRKLGRNTVEDLMPEEHKKLIRYITKQEKISKKKKEVKRANRKMELDEIAEENKKKAKMEDDEENEDADVDFTQMEAGPEMEVENNNLLLKFDTMKEKFHFVEHPIAKIKEKKKKEAEAIQKDKDVFFNEQTGKIYVNDDDSNVTGKKRKADFNLHEGMLVEDDASKQQKEQPRTIRKVVRINHERAMAKQANPEEETKANANTAVEEPQRRKSVLNKNIIGDLKIFNSETLNPTAYIPINPKILNKRNRSNAARAFEFLVSKKKTGSLAGLKSKIKS